MNIKKMFFNATCASLLMCSLNVISGDAAQPAANLDQLLQTMLGQTDKDISQGNYQSAANALLCILDQTSKFPESDKNIILISIQSQADKIKPLLGAYSSRFKKVRELSPKQLVYNFATEANKINDPKNLVFLKLLYEALIKPNPTANAIAFTEAGQFGNAVKASRGNKITQAYIDALVSKAATSSSSASN
jgi:hypothetical protein